MWLCAWPVHAHTDRGSNPHQRPPPPPTPTRSPRFLWVETVLVYSLRHGTLVPGVACLCNETGHCRSERRTVWGYCRVIQVIELFMASCSLLLLGQIFNPVCKNEPTQPEPLNLLPPTTYQQDLDELLTPRVTLYKSCAHALAKLRPHSVLRSSDLHGRVGLGSNRDGETCVYVIHHYRVQVMHWPLQASVPIRSRFGAVVRRWLGQSRSICRTRGRFPARQWLTLSHFSLCF